MAELWRSSATTDLTYLEIKLFCAVVALGMQASLNAKVYKWILYCDFFKFCFFLILLLLPDYNCNKVWHYGIVLSKEWRHLICVSLRCVLFTGRVHVQVIFFEKRACPLLCLSIDHTFCNFLASGSRNCLWLFFKSKLYRKHAMHTEIKYLNNDRISK